MPGHMGQVQRTIQNLTLVRILADKNLLLVKGAIPGANGDDVIVRSAIKGQPVHRAKAAAPKADAPAKDAKPAAKPAAAPAAKK